MAYGNAPICSMSACDNKTASISFATLLKIIKILNNYKNFKE